MATYTDLTDLDLPAFAARYGLSALAIEPLTGGAANSSFKERYSGWLPAESVEFE
jgi:hypothetical protein